MYVFVSAIGLILFKSTSEMFKRCIILKMWSEFMSPIVELVSYYIYIISLLP